MWKIDSHHHPSFKPRHPSVERDNFSWEMESEISIDFTMDPRDLHTNITPVLIDIGGSLWAPMSLCTRLTQCLPSPVFLDCTHRSRLHVDFYKSRNLAHSSTWNLPWPVYILLIQVTYTELGPARISWALTTISPQCLPVSMAPGNFCHRRIQKSFCKS